MPLLLPRPYRAPTTPLPRPIHPQAPTKDWAPKGPDLQGTRYRIANGEGAGVVECSGMLRQYSYTPPSGLAFEGRGGGLHTQRPTSAPTCGLMPPLPGRRKLELRALPVACRLCARGTRPFRPPLSQDRDVWRGDGGGGAGLTSRDSGTTTRTAVPRPTKPTRADPLAVRPCGRALCLTRGVLWFRASP